MGATNFAREGETLHLAREGESVHFAREGEKLQLQGRTEESLRLLGAGVARNPRDVAGRLVLARVCREADRVDDARAWFESVLRDDPECPSARAGLVVLTEGPERERHLERLRAREPWDDGLEWLPQSPAAAVEDEFEEDFAEAEIDVDSLPHVATVTLAEIYLQQGLKEQAAQIYRQLLERQPGDVSVRKRLEEIETSTSEAQTRATGGTG
jgi:tetratricopeptide (TPR) repeat protein